MLFEPIDLNHLPNTSNIDGVPIYANPIKFIRRLFFRRINLCLKFHNIKKGTVLDAGCGSGNLLPTLSRII
jgi:2-polyprenyl-3-methyl-5-hydroxy-6-metoxy-1,4-benzoquinol methylase